MNDRTLALLRYHFDHGSRRVFTVASSTETPDVLIVDYDHPGTRAQLESGSWHGVRSLMVLAYGEPPIDNAVVVHKPLDRARLDAAAHQLLHEAPQHPAGRLRVEKPVVAPAGSVPAAQWTQEASNTDRAATPGPSPSTTQIPESTMREPAPSDGEPAPVTTTPAAPFDAARHEAKMTRLCGAAHELEEVLNRTDEANRYDPRQSFNHWMTEAMAQRSSEVQAIRLGVSTIDVYALPVLKRIYMTESLKQAANVERLFGVLGPEDVATQSYGNAELAQLLSHLNGRARYTYTFDAFAWLGALFAARGRLPHGTDIHQPLRLWRWPNFTRLELTPECMNIAAAWSAHALSLAEAVDLVGCEPRYVTAFYNGARSLDILNETGTPTTGEHRERP